MSDEVLEWKPRGHPVRWAVGIVATIVVLCSLSILFGLANPRVKARVAAWDGAGDLGSPVSIRLELANEALSLLTYRITDCNAAVGEGPEVPVTYRTVLGVERTTAHALREGADMGSWTMELIQRQCDIEVGGELPEG